MNEPRRDRSAARAALWGYVIIAFIELVAEINRWEVLILVVKPLLTGSLILYWSQIGGKGSGGMIMALVFGLLGDVYLLPAMDRFLFGLGWFLCGHLCYIYLFARSQNHRWTDLFYWLPGVMFAAALLACVLPAVVPAMRLPIVLYAVVLIAMAAQATALGIRKRRTALAVGAWLFVGSDGMIALNRFVEPVPAARVLIMTSYIAAQFLLTVGYAGIARGAEGTPDNFD